MERQRCEMQELFHEELRQQKQAVQAEQELLQQRLDKEHAVLSAMKAATAQQAKKLDQESLELKRQQAEFEQKLQAFQQQVWTCRPTSAWTVYISGHLSSYACNCAAHRLTVCHVHCPVP